MSNTFRTLDDLCRIPSSAPTTRETTDHAELARLAEAAAPYWRAANLACGGNPIAVDLVAPFVGAMSPAVCSALLSEIAALRGDLTVSRDDLDQLQAHFRQRDREATQAERQRDELRKALEPFGEAAESLDDETRDHDHIWEQPAAMSIDAGHLRTARALLANQGADQ